MMSLKQVVMSMPFGEDILNIIAIWSRGDLILIESQNSILPY